MRALSVPTLVPLAFVTFLTVGVLMPLPDRQEPQLPAPPSPMDLPLVSQHADRFVENLGQWPEAVRFALQKRDSMTWFDDSGWTHVKGCGEQAMALRMSFVNKKPAAATGEEKLGGRHNWLVGQDPKQWVQGAGAYRHVRYRSAFEGVDVVVRKGRDPKASFEYDLLLESGADIEGIVMRCEGHRGLRVATDGALIIDTPLGTLRQAPPVTWAVGPDGEKQMQDCRFVRIDEDHFGFEVPGWDGLCALVIDPGMIWSTFLGGGGLGGIMDVETDKTGRITVTGNTRSSDFPTTLGAFDRKFNAAAYRTNIFVSQFTPDGKKLIFSTYLGGSTGERAYDLHVASSGIITVAGQTFSSDYPTTKGVYQPKFGGGSDAFITKLDPTGSKLIWSTYFGGGGAKSLEECRALDVDAQGNVVIAGDARGSMPTTPGAFQKTQGSGFSVNPFVAKFGSAGKKLIFSTFCGGTNFGLAKTVAIDSKGNVLIAGHSGSKDYPVTKGAYQVKPASTGFTFDAFLTKLDSTGSKLVWSTWIGGGAMDTVEEVKFDASEDVVFTGWTRSASYPTTTGSYQTAFAGGTNFRGDCFLSKLDASGSALIWSTFLGGSAGEEARALSLDAAGNPTIVGTTGSKDFPITKGAFSSKILGANYGWTAEGFVARLSSDAKTLLYSSYLGGNNIEGLAAVSVLREGDVIVGGSSFSPDFPTTSGAYQTKLKGQANGIVTRLDLLPSGIARVGRSTDCNGPVLLYPRGIFSAANGTGELIVGNAPKKTPGLLVLGGASSATGFAIGGARIHLDPQKWLLVLPVNSDLVGRTRVPLQFGQLPKGFRFAAQTVWLNNQACAHKSFFSASAALDITLR